MAVPMQVFRQIRTAIQHLDPDQVREAASRPFSVGLAATSSESFGAMEDFLAPPHLSRGKRLELLEVLHRAGDVEREFDIVIREEGLLGPANSFSFHPDRPEATLRRILIERKDLSLALARRLPPFRRPVIGEIIRQVSRENALFALMTALPDMLPSIFSVGWATAEFASDTAVITVNQVRMAFLIATASGRDAGYRAQKHDIAAIIAGAFGWRALARELAGKIPFGGGLVPKAAIAYAGTYVAGIGLERYYRAGYRLTAAERELAYSEALESGRRFAKWALGSAGK